MRYHQFASRAYFGVAESVFKMEFQQEKSFCELRFEVSRSVITVQHDFCARFRKDTWWEIKFLLTFETATFFLYNLYIFHNKTIILISICNINKLVFVTEKEVISCLIQIRTFKYFCFIIFVTDDKFQNSVFKPAVGVTEIILPYKDTRKV
jgi:hypothetical protein